MPSKGNHATHAGVPWRASRCYTFGMASAGDMAASAALDPGAPLTRLPGIGPTTARRLAVAGIRTVRDLVLLVPRRCRALRELEAPAEGAVGELVRLRGTVTAVQTAWLPGRRSMVTVTFACADGSSFAASFFGQPWLKKQFADGQRRWLEGVLQMKGKRFVLQGARALPLRAETSGEVQLRYPEIDGVAASRLVQWIAHALAALDWSQVTLPPLPKALAEFDREPRALFAAIHRPKDVAEHEAARTNFVVQEAVELFRHVAKARAARARRAGRPYPVDGDLARRIEARIPLAWTACQRKAIEELWRRLAGPAAMGALLQGDVGTGKTAVAIAAALAVLARGDTVVFLAPTELLAEQHHATVAGWLAGSGVEVALYTASSRRTPTAGAAPLLLFGTHALLSGDFAVERLSFVIVDEQHRFGVEQRMALVKKGDNPHVLVMTATPIPRTMALVLFGDLDAVTLRTRPAGRRPVPAVHVETDGFARVVRSIGRAVRRGGRVFVVCPAVGEDGEKGGVVRVHEALAQHFRTGLVHGRLDTGERRLVLERFRDGAVDVLVGTTVLEVGVDVPAATLMVVVAAHRFGIATLHQLRGRVGRGTRRGLAILCGPKSDRVAAVCRTTDGFALAEQDLALRGSGELLGTQQSGFGELRALDPVSDLPLLLRVRQAVQD
jgi:ATP-dependent DNA helicase RecG